MPDTSPITSILKEYGLRRTPVRVRVLKLLGEATRPMSVPELLADMPDVDSVTAYRTLNTFARKQIVHRLRGDDRSWLYALSEPDAHADHRHAHFVCDLCGRVECLSDTTLPDDIEQTLGVPGRFKIDRTEVFFHGVCPRCQ